MLEPEADLELLNDEGQTVDEGKFSSFFLGPTYRTVKELFCVTATFLICLGVSALIFTYTERKWDIINADLGEKERDQAFSDPAKRERMKTWYAEIEQILESDIGSINSYLHIAKQQCYLKRDKYDFEWHWGGAIDYVISLITTTGWGVTIPASAGGKFFTVFYFIGAIPFISLFLYSLVDMMDTTVTRIRRFLASRIEAHEANPDGWALYTVTAFLGLLTLLMLLVMAGVSARREHSWDISGQNLVPGWAGDGKQQWTYWDALYYQLYSMLTVGLGDFHHRAYDGTFSANQFFFVFIPICLYLAVVKTLMNQFKKKRSPRPINLAGHQ